MVWNIPLVVSGQRALSQRLGPAQHICWEMNRVGKAKRKPSHVQALFSNNQKVGMLPTLFQPQIQNTHTAVKKVNSTSARLST